MVDEYRGKPFKYGFIQDFQRLSPETLAYIADDLGLYMSAHQLTLLRNAFNKQDGRYTIDELYLADAYIEAKIKYSPEYKIDNFECDTEEVREAFSDLMEKRKVLFDRSDITIESLIANYNKYLLRTGYDDESGKTYALVPTKNTLPAASTMKYHTTGNFITDSSSLYALAPTSGKSRYNTSKERVAAAEYRSGELAITLVKIPEFPLAYESLSDFINASAHMAADITYAAPIGGNGLFCALEELNTGFSLDQSKVTALMPEITHPYQLAYPISAAVILSHPAAAQNIVTALTSGGFESATVGTSYSVTNSFCINFGGYYHMLDIKAVKAALPTLICAVKSQSTPTEDNGYTSLTASGVSISTFTDTSFQNVYRVLRKAIDTLTYKNPDNRLLGYVILPTSESKPEGSMDGFLAVYRAFAENAVPIRETVRVPSSDNCPMCVMIIDSEFKISSKEADSE